VRPGDQLVIQGEIVNWRGHCGRINTIAKVGRNVAAEAVLSFVLVNPEDYITP